MTCLKAFFFALLVVTFFSSFGFATPVPVHAEPDNKFEITAAELVFTPVPWVSPMPGNTASITLYTIADYTPHPISGIIAESNLGITEFSDGGHELLPYGRGQSSGDLAVKYINQSGQTINFIETVITVGLNVGDIDIYLPQFDLIAGASMHFWAAEGGSTYYANVTGIPGSATGLNMTALDSITAGDIARVPEPVSIALLGLGGFFLRRRKTTL